MAPASAVADQAETARQQENPRLEELLREVLPKAQCMFLFPFRNVFTSRIATGPSTTTRGSTAACPAAVLRRHKMSGQLLTLHPTFPLYLLPLGSSP
jgi:hypothetical protein